jgi:apoptosis-inducing factor 3
MSGDAELTGPDLSEGIAEGELRDGAPVLGHAGGEAVVLVRDGGRVHAVGATCTHYGGPLAEGLVAGGAIRCPWHHACFDLATGAPHGPALAPIACWDVEVRGGTIRVGARREPAAAATEGPSSVVIVGGGAAGVACAETLRQEGYRGPIAMISAEGSDPVDRPNLSKDYLAGAAPEEWVFLRTGDALAALEVEVVDAAAEAIDPAARVVRAGGRELGYGALLIATGAEPIRLPLDGADRAHVHTLRSLADSRAIAAAATAGRRAVVIGASFIGLEAAASLRARGVEVTVVAPEAVPLARILGDEVGAAVRRVHEAHGTSFRLGRKPASIGDGEVVLDDGEILPAELVVMGVGVRPRLDLATAAGLEVDRGIVVDDQLRASAEGVWAAGDVARYPWAGARARIEHWQVAIRHGQRAARSMLGRAPARPDVPFFWSQHHDVTIGYVGHAERFDAAEVHGDLAAGDAHVVYRDGDRIAAVATLGRDRLALEVEAAMERGDDGAVRAAVAG